ncbi:hypothetical protein ACOMHN_036909 [Nucella lapillus]
MPSTPADTCQVETTTTGTEIHQAVTASGMGHTMPGIKQRKAHTVEPTHHSASIRGRLTTHQMRKRWAGTPQGPTVYTAGGMGVQREGRTFSYGKKKDILQCQPCQESGHTVR